MSKNLIQIKNLTTSVGLADNKVNIVNNVSFDIKRGETFVLLGESGSGKSITALSIMRLLPAAVKISSGKVILGSKDLFELGLLSEKEYNQIKNKLTPIILEK